MKRGEIWWAELADPQGLEPGFRRPVVVVQADSFNRSRIDTVLVATMTTNLELGEAPGNVLVSRRESRLPRNSVVNVSQVMTLDKRFLVQRVCLLPLQVIERIDSGLRSVLAL